MTVIDASVAIKWFAAEHDSEAAIDILTSEARLTAPDHLVGEVARGLLRKCRSGSLSRDEARGTIQSLPIIISLSPMGPLGPLAFDIADQASVTIYDALYVALAALSDDVLVTADQRLCDGLRSSPWAGRAQHLDERSALRGFKRRR